MSDNIEGAAVEAMARAICPDFYGSPWERTSVYRQGLCESMATAALTALTTLHPGIGAVLRGEAKIVAIGPMKYGCHVDLEHGVEPDACVIDEGRPGDCIYAAGLKCKEDCREWRLYDTSNYAPTAGGAA